MPKAIVFTPMFGKMDNGMRWAKVRGLLQLGKGLDQGPMVDFTADPDTIELLKNKYSDGDLTCFLAQVSFAAKSKKVEGKTFNITLLEEIEFLRPLTQTDFDVFVSSSTAYDVVDKSTGEVKTYGNKPKDLKPGS